MSTFESDIVKASCDSEAIFKVLSDLRNIELIKDKVPTDKISDLKFTQDTCHFNVNPFGTMGLKIVNREPNKTVKFGSDNSPIGFDFWIQLKEVGENDTRIKLTMKSEMNFIVKQMVEPMIQPMLNKMANMLAMLPYKEIKNKE